MNGVKSCTLVHQKCVMQHVHIAVIRCVYECYSVFKGTGTRDLIWLKVVSLDRSVLVGLTDDL